MKFSFSKTIFLTAAMALLCAVCVGCGQPYAADGPSGVSSSQSEARPESDNVTSLPAESSSQPAESFVPQINSDDESMPPDDHASSAPLTENEDFNLLFARTPIDQAYRAASQSASTTQEMVAAAEKFIPVWKAELYSCYGRLMGYLSANDIVALKRDQDQWEAGLWGAISQIRSEAEAAGGSMAQVAVADNTLSYYRARAAVLYEQLYRYEPDFTYIYGQE